MGKSPRDLRVLDMNRHGIAQVARDPDGSLRLALPEAVLFDFDKDVLNANAERALAGLKALVLDPAEQSAVRLEGHTDDRGADEYNQGLSLRRAESVRAWLVDHGRAKQTLSVDAFGERKPRVPNDTDAHRAANRRVEFVIAATR